MKKIVYIALAVIIIVGTIITATIGLNVDIIYKEHQELQVYVGKETDIKEIMNIVKDVFGKQKTTVTKIESFNDMFLVKTKSVSEEQIESLKQKVGEKFGIEDTSNIITSLTVGKLRLKDLAKPYVLPTIISTLIILAVMAIRYNKLGSVKIVLQTGGMLILAELLFLSVLAITRCPINRYTIPAGLTVYMATIIAINIQNMNNLEEKINKEDKSIKEEE